MQTGILPQFPAAALQVKSARAPRGDRHLRFLGESRTSRLAGLRLAALINLKNNRNKSQRS